MATRKRKPFDQRPLSCADPVGARILEMDRWCDLMDWIERAKPGTDTTDWEDELDQLREEFAGYSDADCDAWLEEMTLLLAVYHTDGDSDDYYDRPAPARSFQDDLRCARDRALRGAVLQRNRDRYMGGGTLTEAEIERRVQDAMHEARILVMQARGQRREGLRHPDDSTLDVEVEQRTGT